MQPKNEKHIPFSMQFLHLRDHLNVYSTPSSPTMEIEGHTFSAGREDIRSISYYVEKNVILWHNILFREKIQLDNCMYRGEDLAH